MEIREYYDEGGVLTRNEVVDVSRELEETIQRIEKYEESLKSSPEMSEKSAEIHVMKEALRKSADSGKDELTVRILQILTIFSNMFRTTESLCVK